jgi:hypothetical protein
MHIPPVVFADGTAFYEKFAAKYKRHKKGLFILAPSGAGKTHFCTRQAEPHWIDGDDLWFGAGAHPKGPWWNEPIATINKIDMRCDILTHEAMENGFWIMGASNYWLTPNAIVIPPWETHKKFIAHREANNYDGGATTEDFDQVRGHITWMRTLEQKGVPVFESIEQAVGALTRDL